MLDSGLDYNIAENLLISLALAAKKVKIPKKQKPKFFYVASKKSDKLHIPECVWAGKIKKKNAVWFKTKTEAESIGYQMHDCILVHPVTNKTQRVSERKKEVKEIQKMIENLEKLIKKTKSQGDYDRKKLEMIEVRLNINKSKIAKILPQRGKISQK
ncbi:MAG: hypothetical protein MAG795_00320 [Candidatus Woesearchaeota archaeon]|nr:hypothetical protein [Candidatus Woesearchaeota archaeon]